MSSSTYSSFQLHPIRSSEYAVRFLVANPPINLLNGTLLKELHEYLTSLQSSPAAAPKVLVVSSTDGDVWTSHLDLHIISAKYPMKKGDPGHLLHLLGRIIELFQTLPVIFIAEANSLAVGGGNEFAVHIDMRFAGPQARFGVAEAAGGVVYGGGLQQLTRLVSAARALEILLSSRAVTGKEAERMGLVNRAMDDEEHLRGYVDDLATRIAMFPRGGIEATKMGVVECLAGNGSMQRDLQRDLQRLGELAHTKEAQKAISALIERGGDQARSGFELALPDSGSEVWE